MSNSVNEEWVRLHLSRDPKYPVELRFGPHLDDTGAFTDDWTIEYLTRAQAIRLHRELGSLLANSMPGEVLVGTREQPSP
jgi:hypothetical protein